MAGGSWRQADVVCPFWKRDGTTRNGKREIHCEGLMAGNEIILRYDHPADYRIQMDVFCCGRPDRCEVYRILMEKYEED